MKALTKKQADSLDNLGFTLDQDNMNELLKIILSRQPEINLKTKEGYEIKKSTGDNGSFYLQGQEVGKLAGLYTETPERILIKIASKVKREPKERIMTWHFLTQL